MSNTSDLFKDRRGGFLPPAKAGNRTRSAADWAGLLDCGITAAEEAVAPDASVGAARSGEPVTPIGTLLRENGTATTATLTEQCR